MADLADLIGVAVAARENAYAPYSQYQVGAALMATDGTVFAGCNMENGSYGLTICAERVAFGAAVAAGKREFVRIVIVAEGARPVPCGACLQVMSEFAPDLPVTLAAPDGEVAAQFTLSQLLPHQFVFGHDDDE